VQYAYKNMFEKKAKTKLEELDVRVYRIEKDNDLSIVFHIPKLDNEKIEKAKDEIEKELNAVVALSEMSGMNVVIIESNDLEE